MLDTLLQATIALAQSALAVLGTPLVRQGELLRHAGGFVAQVDLSCTALWPAAMGSMALCVAGALRGCAPLRLAGLVAGGVGVIALVNQLRLVGVIWVGVHAPAHFEWVHVAAGPMLLVAAGAALVFVALAQPALRRAPGAGQARPVRA
ncbi:MAG: exosortase/archaeosortase family protein [Rubrivivax sp.]|nr:exosortase/archaeosortase family protein [Rubrivivax sp.]